MWEGRKGRIPGACWQDQSSQNNQLQTGERCCLEKQGGQLLRTTDPRLTSDLHEHTYPSAHLCRGRGEEIRVQLFSLQPEPSSERAAGSPLKKPGTPLSKCTAQLSPGDPPPEGLEAFISALWERSPTYGKRAPPVPLVRGKGTEL